MADAAAPRCGDLRRSTGVLRPSVCFLMPFAIAPGLAALHRIRSPAQRRLISAAISTHAVFDWA